VERRALTPLFDRNPLLGGKFYKLLALVLLRRVRSIVRVSRREREREREKIWPLTQQQQT
jgi:hypothetical protein